MKKSSNILIILLIVLLLSGCWSRRELNEIGIATALGIDKSEDGYEVTVQILNPGEIAGKAVTTRTEVVTFKTTGETVFEALRKLSIDVPRIIYLAHIREIIFGEEFAKEGIGKALDFISRDHEMRTDFFISVAKGTTAYEVLNVQTALEKIPANKLFNALQYSEQKWAPSKTVKLDELINSIVSKGIQPVLTGIYVEGDPNYGSNLTNVQNVTPKTKLKVDSIGVFKNDQLIGWLTRDESKGFNYIKNNISSTVVTVPCQDGKVSIETFRSKTKIKGKLENGSPKIEIKVESEGNVGEAQCEMDLSKPESIKELEENYKNDIKSKMEQVMKKSQEEYESDIFGFGEAIHRADPKKWKELQENWDEDFSNLVVTIHVEAYIRRLGTITESFQKDIKE
jgi:spore germination protein KC